MMRFSAVLALFASVALTDVHARPWTYRDSWSRLGQCAHKDDQSPIDIVEADTANVAADGTPIGPLNLRTAHGEIDVHLETNLHTWEVAMAHGPNQQHLSIDWNGKVFNLVQFHFHSPSENTISGVHYDMECHFVHKSSDDPAQVLVIAVFMKVGDEVNAANAYLSKFWDKFPAQAPPANTAAGAPGDTRVAGTVSDPYRNFLPMDKSYYYFKGSFTTPNCDTNVDWVVMKSPVVISLAQRQSYRAGITAITGNQLVVEETPQGVALPWDAQLGNNERATQPLGGRRVTYHQASGAEESCKVLGPDPSDTHLNSEHEVFEWAEKVFFPLSLLFLTALVVGSIMHSGGLTFIPESAIVILLGAFLGGVYLYNGLEQGQEKMFGELNATVLNLVLLPMIVFEAGYSLRVKDFASQSGYICMFAMIGTVISTSVVAGCILLTSDWHGIVNARTAFAFASLISATDPVATLGTYSALKVEPLLNIFVFGESTINDAVAIVLFKVLNSNEYMGLPFGCNVDHPGTWEVMFEVAKGVVVIFFGSILVGVILAMIFCLILRGASMRHSQTLEILFLFLSSFLTFSAAESLKMSGIIAVLFQAIMMQIYGKAHMSSPGNLLAAYFIKSMATMADLSVFLLVGIDVVLINTNGLEFALLLMPILLLGRACATFPIGMVVNFMKRRRLQDTCEEEDMHLLDMKRLFMMWHAGLRGGIALVLCLELGDWVDVLDGIGTKEMMRNATFVVIFVFLIIFGGSTEAFLNLFKIPMGAERPANHLYKLEHVGKLKDLVKRLHKGFLVPMLIGANRFGELEDEKEDQVQTDARAKSDVVAILHEAEHGQRHMKRTNDVKYNGDVVAPDRAHALGFKKAR